MKTITHILKRVIAESGMSQLGLEKACGVNRISVMRFTRGDTSLSLAQAEILCEYFGLELTPVKKRRT